MRFRALVTALLMLLGLIAAAQPAQAADPALTLSYTNISVVKGSTKNVEVSTAANLPNGATPVVTSTDETVASVVVVNAVGGKAVLEVTGLKSGSTTMTVSLTGYTSVQLSVMVETTITACTAAQASTPCIRSVEKGMSLSSLTDVTSLNASDYGSSYQFSAASTTLNELVKLVLDMGAGTESQDYFVKGGGQVQDFTMATENGHRIVTVVVKGVNTSAVTNNGSGAMCRVGACDENLVADFETVGNHIVVWPAGSGFVPSSFAGGWISSNAQSLSLGSFAGQFSFTVAAPHFDSTCPRSDSTWLAIDPAACAGKVNTGFYDVFIPAQALATIFNMPGLTAAQFTERMLINDSTNGGSAVNLADSEDIEVIDRDGGLLIRISGFTYSWHDISIKPAPVIVNPPATENTGGSSGGGGGGGGGSSAPAVVETPAPVAAPVEAVVVETPPAPQPPAEAPRNPVATFVAAPGISLISAAEAASIQDRVMRNAAAATLGTAPRVVAQAGRPLALVVPGQTPGATVSVRIKVGGKYLDLGQVTVDSKGRTALPVLKLSRPGVYTIAIVDPATGKTSYLKVQNTAARTTARA